MGFIVATRTNALWQSVVCVYNVPYRRVATRTNALWQRYRLRSSASPRMSRNPHECAVAKTTGTLIEGYSTASQPARMRCGKGILGASRIYRARSQPARMRCGKGQCWAVAQTAPSRNPHECAVAKLTACDLLYRFLVATRTNALWQRLPIFRQAITYGVATRTNALWQSLLFCQINYPCRVATRTNALWQRLSVAQNEGCAAVATRTNALWQSAVRTVIPDAAIVATRTNALWQRCLRLCPFCHRRVATRTNALWQS